MLLSAAFLFLLATAVGATPRYLTPKTKEFAVNGKAIPEVDFDIGESYAGYLDNTPSGNSSLYFWFFPTTNPAADDEVPRLIQIGRSEIGPFLWQPGTYKPTRNYYSWTNLTNIVFVDQPGGTGLSLGPSTVRNDEDVASQFMVFWKHFIETFDLKGRKVYLAGESYAGMYIPYIASAMLDEEDETYYNVAGIHLIDPVINEFVVTQDVPAVSMLNQYEALLALNRTFMEEINKRADECGYSEFMNTALQYPPMGQLPPVPASDRPGCDIWNATYKAAKLVNPCFNPYHIRDYCPYTWNQVGFPASSEGPHNYFNRSDVQKAINAYPIYYSTCKANGVSKVYGPDGDTSAPSSFGVLASVIERTNNTIISHGGLDFTIPADATLISIQNMTWNGAQGFQSPPIEPLFVPYFPHYSSGVDEMVPPFPPVLRTSGAGYLGTTHTERGLTFNLVHLAGHQLPMYAPGAAYRQLELLLGRISNLSEEVESFTSGGVD
ncbi:carboxypeptidase cpdS precursor [Aspergillus terreus NIH2624]|uniref:Carboxypeptidase n=1 Tax=Aspergillus terreus (strain NIH 2624 / FGSC A1156) TaxID=341663 RepID=Q0CNE5_ASPTN|nr:carboxypeptidase cpdS precursor [Aspergillus terreus NIH2624]EAU35236.1 carboxypeptidase cpdS precursor [Aspergillus terreus NIH2624]